MSPGQSGGEARKFTFDGALGQKALADWTVTGEVSIDAARHREGHSGSMKVGPGAQAVLKVARTDGAGKVEIWVYDDGAKPQDAKAHRVGPRWGLVQGDGRVLVAGVFYANYLGGDEGYTASACDGKKWFDELAWLGPIRAPAGWHKWTFNFDPAKGVQILHNGRDLRFDPTKGGLKGFSSVVVWGDAGKGNEQTIWIDEVNVSDLGPVKSVPTAPKKVIGPDPWANPPAQQVVMYTRDKPPATPNASDLPLKTSVSQYGITWTFARPMPVGQFVNGDWYVAGKATVTAIDPKPLYGKEIPDDQLDLMDIERNLAQRIRNGFMLNPPAAMKVAYDSGVRNWFDPSLIARLPVDMKPGDSLVSTISMPKNLVLKASFATRSSAAMATAAPSAPPPC